MSRHTTSVVYMLTCDLYFLSQYKTIQLLLHTPWCHRNCIYNFYFYNSNYYQTVFKATSPQAPNCTE